MCNHKKSKVVESRKLNGNTYRRRVCLKCGAEYWTKEVAANDLEVKAVRQNFYKKCRLGGLI